MKLMKNEEGVSPVIGVILMVAITVILAAVIAVFVFGLAGDLESSSQKDVTIQTGVNDEGIITFKMFAGKDVDSISYLVLTNGTNSNILDENFQVGYINSTGYPKAGDELTFTAVFPDGSRQIVATAP